MQALSERQIEKAVEWWTITLGLKPKFDNLGPTRGADREETVVNDFASVMAGMIADRERGKMADGALEKFAEALRGELAESEEARRGLHVDYGPDVLLSKAASAAGVPSSLFPWKTRMRFGEDGEVFVRHGYGAPEERL